MNSSSLTSMRLSVAGGVARVTLTEGARGNPLDHAFSRELRVVAETLSRLPEVRVIALEAEGPSFSVGGDLKALTADRPSFVDMASAGLAELATAIELFRSHDAPLVAVVQGVAAGGGVGLALACDFILAAEEARFVAAFSGIGLSADTGASFYLPRRVGLTRAAAFLLLNLNWTAREAHAHGMITSVHSATDLRPAAEALVARLAAGPIRAYGDLKRLLDASGASTLSEQLAAEAASIRKLSRTGDAWRALRARLDRSAPTFDGS